MIRSLLSSLFPRPAWHDDPPADLCRRVTGTVLEVLTEAFNEGGVTGDEIVKRLRVRGVPVTASEMETHGLWTVASMMGGEDDDA
jgi:hypothetical protein